MNQLALFSGIFSYEFRMQFRRLALWITFFAIAAGVLLADRLARDRKTRVDELFTSAPGALSIRLAGKYAGSTLATLIPIFLFFSIGAGSILYQTHNLLTIPYALEAFATIILPGILFVSAF